MGFSIRHSGIILANAGYRCEACGAHWLDFPKVKGDAPIDVHSANSLHLWLQKSGMFLITSPPLGHEQMRGRLLKPEGFLVYTLMKRHHDGFCLCNRCHLKVHAIAKELSLAELPDKEFKNDIPRILELVTVRFVLSKGKWTF